MDATEPQIKGQNVEDNRLTIQNLDPRDTLKALIPNYFIGRLACLLGFGLLTLGSVYTHLLIDTSISDLSSSRILYGLLIIYFILFCCSPIYFSIFYPLREHQHYPNDVSHPAASFITSLLYLSCTALFIFGLNLNASPYLLSILLLLTAGQSGGAPLFISIPLIIASTILCGALIYSTVGIYFLIYLFSGQMISLTLFRSLIHDMRSKTMLELSMAELSAAQSLLRDIIERETKIEVARNLHDEIGHLITLIIVNLNRVIKLQGNNNSPLLLETHDLTKQLMNEIRHAVLQLRSDDTVDLNEAIKAFSQSLTKPTIQANFIGFDGICSPRIGEVIFRACQESITNSMRHSNASTVNIYIKKSKGHYHIEIADNGANNKGWSIGNGLTGLKERAEHLLGTFAASSNQDGFRISMTLPA